MAGLHRILNFFQEHQIKQDEAQTPGLSLPQSKALENRVNFGSRQQEIRFAFSHTSLPSNFPEDPIEREHTVNVRRLKGTQHSLEDLAKYPPAQGLVAIASVTGVLPQEPGTL